MKRLLTLAGIITLLFTTCTVIGQGVVDRNPKDVSLVQLIATPERYDGKRVMVIGYLRLEFEGNALYLHSEDYRHSILHNRIRIRASSDMEKNSRKINNHYVLMVAVFDAPHEDDNESGTLRDISRCVKWY